jgi:hypothetical protein
LANVHLINVLVVLNELFVLPACCYLLAQPNQTA